VGGLCTYQELQHEGVCSLPTTHLLKNLRGIRMISWLQSLQKLEPPQGQRALGLLRPVPDRRGIVLFLWIFSFFWTPLSLSFSLTSESEPQEDFSPFRPLSTCCTLFPVLSTCHRSLSLRLYTSCSPFFSRARPQGPLITSWSTRRTVFNELFLFAKLDLVQHFFGASFDSFFFCIFLRTTFNLSSCIWHGTLHC